MEQVTRNTYDVFFGDDSEKIIIWKARVNDIELLAGILAAGAPIAYELNLQNPGKKYYIDSNTDVSEFRLVHNVTEFEIYKNTCKRVCDDKVCVKAGCPDFGQYCIWMKGDDYFKYSLYVFSKASFFQGIVSICNHFGVDFRNYLYGLPFDRNGKRYALADYVMTSYEIATLAPDLDDIDDEEKDDENIIEPLVKDY